MNSKKTLKKVLPMSLAAAMLVSVVPAGALPSDEAVTVVLGEKAFTLAALSNTDEVNQALVEAQSSTPAKGMYYRVVGQNNDKYVSLLGNTEMSVEEQEELQNILYYKKVGTQLVTETYTNFNDERSGLPSIVATSAVAINRTSVKVTFSDGAVVTYPVTRLNEGRNEVDVAYLGVDYTVVVNIAPVTVSSAVAVGRDRITVTFSDGAVRTFSGLTLITGNNSVPFTYDGKSFTYTVNVPKVDASVQTVEFINYRNLKVTFNTEVDEVSASDAGNYYFEIVDGNAETTYGVSHLRQSNQLSKIVTDYVGGADAWWNGTDTTPGHIVASLVNGKTVVNIYLPEDARFTTLVDKETTFDVGDGNNDDERTLFVKQRTSPTESLPDAVTLKKLIKDTNVNVAVRNVKDVDGDFTIDTAVKEMKILDQVKPVLNKLVKISPNAPAQEVLQEGDLPKDLGQVNLIRGIGSNGMGADKVGFIYSEPVFDAHDLNMSDMEFRRSVKLYVDGTLIASSENPSTNLEDYLEFNMDSQTTYEQGKFVTLNAQKAVKRLKQLIPDGNQVPDVNEIYEFQIVGVTDLASNIEVQSMHNLKVKFYDLDPSQIQLVYPSVVAVDQVGDNLFRVEFNREGATGKLRIKNPDGEGIGEITAKVEESAPSENGKYYSYVSVDATDLESQPSVPAGTSRDNYLSYDLQDWILRHVIIENVKAYHGSIELNGSNYNPTAKMKLVDDILSPVVVQPSVVDYDSRGDVLELHVKDTNPWIADENVIHDVKPVKYKYNTSLLRFDEKARVDQDINEPHFKPVVVSYVDANGATHKAVVTNFDLRPNTTSGPMTVGYLESLTWDEGNNNLLIDLYNYPELLDEDGLLVAGATYKVEIPTGYFTDPSRDDWYTSGVNDFEFNSQEHDLLYVDYARVTGSETEAAIGYTSKEAVVNVAIQPEPADSVAGQAVPQTSKQLIYYYEPTDTLRVEFTGTIDVNTLKDKRNYKVDGKTLAQWDTLLGTNTEITYEIIAEKQFATFKIPTNSITETGDVEFIVSGVKHPQGGTMTPVNTTIRLRDNYCPIVVEAKITGDRQLKLRFNEPLRYNVSPVNDEMPNKAARNFKVVVNGMEWTVTSAVLPDPTNATNQREVILNLGNVITDTAVITVQTRNDQNGVMNIVDNSEFNNPLKLATYNATK